MTIEARPLLADPEGVVALRELLIRAGYTREGIQGVLGMSGDLLARTKERPVYVRRLGSAAGALETLIRLFLIDEPVDSTVAERAFGPTPIEPLETLGVIGRTDGALRGLVRIVPHGSIIIASDLPDRDERHADHVAGVHRPSITLSELTVRRPVSHALDMGTGCGIQALLAARHAEHVVATDINERAIAFAALNAALNDVTNIEFRAGSFFEPVAGERFGLVVSNPPYVISPESAYTFRDSGLGRDRVSERLVRALPGFLEEGGFGTIMVSWIQDGGDVPVRPREWLAGSGCDAWILHTSVEDPLTTAAAWNRDLADDEEKYADAIERWVTYFREEGIGALAYGSILMRRRTPRTGDQPNWIRSRELSNDPRVEPADHLLRLFTGPDASDRLRDDDALAAELVTLASGATITRHLRLEADGWAEAAELSMARGLPFSAELDGFTAAMLAGVDGSSPVGTVLEQFAEGHDASPERIRASGLAIVRELIESGMAETKSVPPDRSER